MKRSGESSDPISMLLSDLEVLPPSSTTNGGELGSGQGAGVLEVAEMAMDAMESTAFILPFPL